MVKIEEVKGEQLVKNFAEEMEEMLGRKMKSVKVMRAQAEFHQRGDWNRGHHTHFNVSNLPHLLCFLRGWQKQQRMLIFTMNTMTLWRCVFMCDSGPCQDSCRYSNILIDGQWSLRVCVLPSLTTLILCWSTRWMKMGIKCRWEENFPLKKMNTSIIYQSTHWWVTSKSPRTCITEVQQQPPLL